MRPNLRLNLAINDPPEAGPATVMRPMAFLLGSLIVGQIAWSSARSTSAAPMASAPSPAGNTAGSVREIPECAPNWHTVSSVDPSTNNYLHGVAAIAPDDVWAIGYSAGNHATLTEHWNGNYWAIVPSPPPSDLYNYILTSVSGVASNDAWAVGYMEGQSGQSLHVIEHWNGTQWTEVTSPRP